MSEAGPEGAPPDHWQLTTLLTEIGLARGRLETARSGIHPADQLALRRALLSALEAYATALATRGAPLPYRLRAEIDLYRGLGPRG
jgi:hypothetical protein